MKLQKFSLPSKDKNEIYLTLPCVSLKRDLGFQLCPEVGCLCLCVGIFVGQCVSVFVCSCVCVCLSFCEHDQQTLPDIS